MFLLTNDQQKSTHQDSTVYSNALIYAPFYPLHKHGITWYLLKSSSTTSLLIDLRNPWCNRSHKRPQIHWGTLEAPKPARIKMGNLSTTKMARISCETTCWDGYARFKFGLGSSLGKWLGSVICLPIYCGSKWFWMPKRIWFSQRWPTITTHSFLHELSPA